MPSNRLQCTDHTEAVRACSYWSAWQWEVKFITQFCISVTAILNAASALQVGLQLSIILLIKYSTDYSSN